MLSKCCNLHQKWQHCETNKNTSFLISAFTLGRICGKLNELCAFYNLFIGRTDGILRNCYLFHHSFGKNVNWVYQSWFRILANDTFSSFPHRKSMLIDSFLTPHFMVVLMSGPEHWGLANPMRSKSLKRDFDRGSKCNNVYLPWNFLAHLEPCDQSCNLISYPK